MVQSQVGGNTLTTDVSFGNALLGPESFNQFGLSLVDVSAEVDALQFQQITKQEKKSERYRCYDCGSSDFLNMYVSPLTRTRKSDELCINLRVIVYPNGIFESYRDGGTIAFALFCEIDCVREFGQALTGAYQQYDAWRQQHGELA